MSIRVILTPTWKPPFGKDYLDEIIGIYDYRHNLGVCKDY